MQQQQDEVAVPSAEEMRLRMGEMTAEQVRIAQAAYRMGFMAALPRSQGVAATGMPVGREIFGRTWYTAEQMQIAVSLNAKLAAPLATMLGAAQTDALDNSSNTWRSAMIDAAGALEKHEATLPKPATAALSPSD